jgi:hypothetical protein
LSAAIPAAIVLNGAFAVPRFELTHLSHIVCFGVRQRRKQADRHYPQQSSQAAYPVIVSADAR